MIQRDNQGKEICSNDQVKDLIPETTLDEVSLASLSLANGMAAIVHKISGRFGVEALEEGAGDEGALLSCHIESTRYLETFSVEIGGFIGLADQLSDQTRLLAKKTRVSRGNSLRNRSEVLALSEQIRNLSEISNRNTKSIHDIVYGIQGQVHEVISDLKKADKAGLTEAGNIKAITSKLKNIISGLVYIAKDFRSIQVNAKDVLTKAEVCFLSPSRLPKPL